MTTTNDWTKEEMMVMDTETLVEMVLARDEELLKILNAIPVRATTGRKEQVLNCLRTGINSIDKIAESLGINNKNVSSQLSYLRKDGHMIYSIRINGNTTLKLEE